MAITISRVEHRLSCPTRYSVEEPLWTWAPVGD